MKRSLEKGKTQNIKKHMTVRIPRGLTDAIEDFLKSDQAERMGFDSKADVVTTAVRQLLTQYGYYDSQVYDSQRKKIENQKTIV